MIDKLKNVKKETVSYLVFGVFTTVVNYMVFAVGLSLMGQDKVLMVNMIAFVTATLFAYITNKIFVFESRKWNVKLVLLEMGKFTGARVFALLVEQAGLYVASKWWKLGEIFLGSVNCLVVAKVVLSFGSVLLNYLASKFFVFKKEKKNESTNDCSGL